MNGPSAPAQFRQDSHPRAFDGFQFVYAVLSRRAKGISIGINLSPHKRCNFGCIYCQVDRTGPGARQDVDEALLQAELAALLDAGARGELAERARRDGAPQEHCRVADVAFSGDGEPTAYPRFAEVVETVGQAVAARLPGTPLTLITNATLFHLPRVRAGLDALAARGGVVWAKLDAGSEERFRLINGSGTSFDRVLDNIREEARRRPLVIQSLFLRLGAEEPSEAEIDAYAGRLAAIVAAGGALAGVQVTTVARKPPRPDVAALSEERLRAIAERVRAALPDVPVEVYPSRTFATPPAAGSEDAR